MLQVYDPEWRITATREQLLEAFFYEVGTLTMVRVNNTNIDRIRDLHKDVRKDLKAHER